MKLHRFLGNFDFTKAVVLSTDLELINQLKNVLHLIVGTKVILINQLGEEIEAEIHHLTKNEVSFLILTNRPIVKKTNRLVTLYCAILKKENFELVVQKATECGVAKIVPIISERTIKTGFRRERLEKIIKEAVEQSGRSILPILTDPISLFDFSMTNENNDKNLFFIPGEKKIKTADFLSDDRMGIFIGPEGGWSEGEIIWAKEQNFVFTGLGDFVLRGETAAIVASYLVTNY